MGCQRSNELNSSQTDTVSEQDQFNISYRQFVANDRGEVCQFYHFSKIISRSATSIVRKVIQRNSKIQRVCKIVPLSKSEFVVAMREVQALRRMDHPNIVKIQQYFLENSFLYIVMEQVPGKTLMEQIIANNGINLVELVSVMRQLLSAVQYIHKKNFVHRLITANNILLVKTQKQGYILKLVDFSECIVKDIPRPAIIPKRKSHQTFMPPQRLNQTSNKHLDKLDIWGCGFILYSLLSGHSLKNNNQGGKKIIQQLLKENQSPLSVDLISKMLEQNPDKRFSAKDCLTHQFFNVNQRKNQKKISFMFKNLLQFRISQKLKALFYMYASLNTSDFRDKSQYVIQFHNLDRNKDGRLDYNEVVLGLENTFQLQKKTAQKHALQIFKSLDKNNNGFLDYSEFVVGTMAVNQILSQQRLKKMFQQMDQNNDGKITQQQLNEVFEGVYSFKQLQYNKKQLQFTDFRNIMLSILNAKGFLSQENLH